MKLQIISNKPPVNITTYKDFLMIMAILEAGKCRWEDRHRPLSKNSKERWKNSGVTIIIVPSETKASSNTIKIAENAINPLSPNEWLKEAQKIGPNTIDDTMNFYHRSIAA